MHNDMLFNHPHFHSDWSYMAKFLAVAKAWFVTARSAATTEGNEIMSLDNLCEFEDFNNIRSLHSMITQHILADSGMFQTECLEIGMFLRKDRIKVV